MTKNVGMVAALKQNITYQKKGLIVKVPKGTLLVVSPLDDIGFYNGDHFVLESHEYDITKNQILPLSNQVH